MVQIFPLAAVGRLTTHVAAEHWTIWAEDNGATRDKQPTISEMLRRVHIREKYFIINVKK